MKKSTSSRRSFGRRVAGVTMPIGRKRVKWGRNWPCLCGSKKKYKQCCMKDTDQLTTYDGNAEVVKLPEDLQDLIDQHIAAEKAKEEGAELSEDKGVANHG